VIAVWALPERCDAAGHLEALGSLMPPPAPGAPGPFALSDELKLKALATDADLMPVAVALGRCCSSAFSTPFERTIRASR
jgi:hypothetical protein